ncbi:MAG: oligosaccharide flippase family protein [candidate division KSB1 bacterium]|nr:oligosaccharide flippase family protein [candidate division KSB1 bacterium]
MFQSLKRLMRHSAVYGIGHILTRGVGFLLLPLYTNFLNPDALGIAAIMFLYLAISTILYTYGLDSAFLRYFILAEDESEKIRLFSTGFLTVLFTSVLFSVLGYLFADDLARVIVLSNVEKFLQNPSSGSPLQHYLNESTIYFQYAATILFFDALAILPFLVLRAKERSKLFVTLKLLNVIVNLSLNIVFVAKLGYGLRGIFLANVFSSAFTFLTLLPVILQHFRPVLLAGELKKLLVFGLPYLPSTWRWC